MPAVNWSKRRSQRYSRAKNNDHTSYEKDADLTEGAGRRPIGGFCALHVSGFDWPAGGFPDPSSELDSPQLAVWVVNSDQDSVTRIDLAASAVESRPAGSTPAQVTPISVRYVIASGEQGESWELTLYRAEIADPSGEVATGWCLDLDAPSMNDPDRSTTTSATTCTIGEEPSWSGAIGAFSAYPEFADGQSLIYGEVSDEVARVDVRIGVGEARQATLVPAPMGTPARLGYFVALVPGSGEIEIVALDEDGQVLQVKDAGRVPAGQVTTALAGRTAPFPS